MKRQRLVAVVLAVILGLPASTHAAPEASRSASLALSPAETLRVTSSRPEERACCPKDYGLGPNGDHSHAAGFDDLPAGCSWVDRTIADTLVCWRVGDRIDLRVLPEREIDSSYVVNYLPCDPFTVRATLGAGELPPALEWELLGLGSDPVLWADDLAFPASALDSRFKACASDVRGWYHVRVTVLAADTTGRSNRGGPLARLRKAVQAYREARFMDVRSLIGRQSGERSGDVLGHYLLAGAFEGLGRCEEQVREAGWLLDRGYGCANFSVVEACANCEEVRAARATAGAVSPGGR